MSKKVKISISIVLIGIMIFVLGYYLRIDRFGMAQISWIDCIQINNSRYYSDYDRSPVESSLVGEMIGEVKFNVSENVHNPSYRFRNGDATHLVIGTEVYSLKSENNAIAVKIDENYFLYQTEQ